MNAAVISNSSAGRVEMPVGYTDPVLGVGSWPITTAAWAVEPAPSGTAGATLAVSVAMQAAGLIANGSAPGDAASATASDTASRFGAIWYQMMQPDMHATLATSLQQPAGGDPEGLPVALDGLRSHLSACYAFCNSAAQLGAHLADPATTANLAAVVEHYGIDWSALGLAAGARSLSSLLVLPATGLLIPSFAVFRAGGTVAALVPTGEEPAKVLADADNTALPLNPGSELVVPSQQQAQPIAGLPIATLATQLNLTLASLVTANRSRNGLLAPGFVFSAQGVEVEVPAAGQAGADASLDEIAATFRDNGVPFDAVMVAGANADLPGMFRAEVELVVDRQLIASGWSLAENGTGVAATTLAGLNTATVDLFAAGTPLFLSASAVTGLGEAPLDATARAYGIEPGELLRHNAGLAPAAAALDGSSGLPIPGLSAWPINPADLRIPYRIRSGQTMGAIAALFLPAGAVPEEALTEANRALPGTIAGGRSLTVAGQTLATQAGDSFDAVMARANPPVTIAQFAAALEENPAALAVDGLLLCPPAQLPAAAGLTPTQLAARYGLSATTLLSANAATPGLILPGVSLRPSPLADTPTLTTAAADSFNALVRRFAAQGVSITLGDLVQGNANVAFLSGAALLLLPPAETRLTAPFGSGGWQFPEVIFPLRSWLTLARNANLVDPAFRGPDSDPGPVVREMSPLAAARTSAPAEQEEGAVTLSLFAAAIEQAIPGLKLATGRVLSAERDPAPTDVWAVSFVAPDGITAVNISPTSQLPGVDGAQPFSFALRPLSNTLEAEAGVEIKSLDPATGGWGDAETVDYQGIDMEVWARAWLAGLDLLATAPYASPAYRVAPDALARLLAAKKRLACAVADGLSPILVPQASGSGAIGASGWQAAREVVYQRLLNQLSRGYDTTAILQFGATVSAPAAAANAKLSGAGRLTDLSSESRQLRAAAGDDPDAWRVAQLGNAKTSLAAGSDTVNFALDVSQPARHRAVSLQPRYAVNEIEFGITPVEAGYDASNWLSFVRPFDQFPPTAFQAPLGEPLVPIPLRAYPDLPALVAQRAQTAAKPQSVEEAVHWSYLFTYTHQGAAQDQIRIELEFNRSPQTARLAVVDRSLFGALAQYAAASETLWQILGGLEGLDSSADNQLLATALDSYAGLAERVAASWSAWWGLGSCDTTVAQQALRREAHSGLLPAGRRSLAAQAPGLEHKFYHYLTTLETGLVNGEAVYLQLSLTQLDGDTDLQWPSITAIREDGAEATLVGQTASGNNRLYDFPTGSDANLMPAFSRLSFRYAIGGLHIADYQNATAGVSVIRNAQLLGPDGPETCSSFVYRTAQLGFPEPLVPLITVDTRIDIGPWSSDPANNPLNQVFAQMFDADPLGRQIAVAIRYGYTLVDAGSDSIETLLPVNLHPRYGYDATTVSGIIDAVAAWQTQVQPVTSGAVWGFAINLYSSTDPALERPLLELKNLVSPIT